MRVRIQHQLCLLIAITALLGLMILAVPLWTQSHSFITNVRSSNLVVTANLKAAHIAQDMELQLFLVQSISTRRMMQQHLKEFSTGNTSDALLDLIETDLISALSGGGKDTLLLQSKVYPPTGDMPAYIEGLVNVTGSGALGEIVLPYNNSDGSSIFLGDPGLGYPRELYPNLSYTDDGSGGTTVTYDDKVLNWNSTLILGPLYLPDGNSALISITIPINNNTSMTEVLGWLTVVLDARLFYDVIATEEGLGDSGEVLLVGPPTSDNLFALDVAGRSSAENADVQVWFVLPPSSNASFGYRHETRAYGVGDPDLPFLMGDYPSVLDAWSKSNDEINNAGSHISTQNEEGKTVSTGYAQVDLDYVDWVVVFEQSHSEVTHPMTKFRNIALICIFSVMGGIILLCVPIAHFAVKPIKRLRVATLRSIATYEVGPSESNDSFGKGDEEKKIGGDYGPDGAKENSISSVTMVNSTGAGYQSQERKKVFQIPEKVPEGKHIIRDELTDLTSTFNEMSDELRVQYARLEERVRSRTIELEQSRNVARAASESKTLFIANISHELRTPLNGIIGMCTIAAQESSLKRVRQSLKIIYKSSDLLLHLLNDLITFSRNSFGQQLTIEESCFKLSEVKAQLLSFFERQARESQIDLRVLFVTGEEKKSPIEALKRVVSFGDASGLEDADMLKNMNLLGDKNRLLQVLMNLVSNSLKFTPEKGAIELRIRCRGFTEYKVQPLESSASGSAGKPLVQSNALLLSEKITPTEPKTTTGNKYLLFDFEVEDTGTGIPEDIQQEIFKPFVQGDAALSRKHGGTGLGLAICAQLAALMGGKIDLKSTVGVGSTFTVSIPLRPTKEKAPSISPSLARSGSWKSGSRPNSILSSLRDEFGADVRKGRTRDPSPAQLSMTSKRRRNSQSEIPRVVGFSNPYIADTDSMYDNDNIDKQSMTSRPPLSRVVSREKEEFNNSNDEGNSKIRSTDPKHLLSPPRRPRSPLQRPRTPTKNTPSSKLATIKSNVAETEDNEPEPAVTQLRVLVAEDNKVNQEVIKRMLRLEKITDVTVAEDGQEALETMQKVLDNNLEEQTASSTKSRSSIPFHVIFMDIQMPRLDGIQATEKIREAGYDGPIVALTAYTDESNREACAKAGMESFLPKPIKRTALKEILAKVREGIAANYRYSQREQESTKQDDEVTKE